MVKTSYYWIVWSICKYSLNLLSPFFCCQHVYCGCLKACPTCPIVQIKNLQMFLYYSKGNQWDNGGFYQKDKSNAMKNFNNVGGWTSNNEQCVSEWVQKNIWNLFHATSPNIFEILSCHVFFLFVMCQNIP